MVDKSAYDIEKALSFRQEPYEVDFTEGDAILYALGIGFSRDPMNKSDFKYTYENADDFAAFPTNVVTVCHRGPFADGDFDVPGIPPFNPMQLLHGEESVTFVKPLTAGAKYVVQEKVADFQDKGKGALLIFDAEIKNAETQELVATVRSSLFVRGIGGFGYKGKIKNSYPKVPKRAPDFVGEEKTDPNQAILYRLTNDRNPLHIDPEMAKMGNFDKPILHGLCFFGFTTRAVQQHFFKANPEAMKQVSVRFTGHVFPGETLVVSAWREGDTIVFVTKTKERGAVCIMGYMKVGPDAKL